MAQVGFEPTTFGLLSGLLFHLPDFVDSLLLNIISGLPNVGSLSHQKKLYFLGRILTLPEVHKVVLDILKLRLNMLNVDSDSNSIGFLSEILHSFIVNIQFNALSPSMVKSINFPVIQKMETDC